MVSHYQYVRFVGIPHDSTDGSLSLASFILIFYIYGSRLASGLACLWCLSLWEYYHWHFTKHLPKKHQNRSWLLWWVDWCYLFWHNFYIWHIPLINLVCSVCTVSHGPSSFHCLIAQACSVWAIKKWRKWGSITYGANRANGWCCGNSRSPLTAVVQWVVGSILGSGTSCELSCLLVLSLATRVFLRVLWFSSLLKNQYFQIPIWQGIEYHLKMICVITMLSS
jgi:hypothetical protein